MSDWTWKAGLVCLFLAFVCVWVAILSIDDRLTALEQQAHDPTHCECRWRDWEEPAGIESTDCTESGLVLGDRDLFVFNRELTAEEINCYAEDQEPAP